MYHCRKTLLTFAIGITLYLALQVAADDSNSLDFSPPPDQRQLPHAMHAAMEQQPSIDVGIRDAALVGDDNRVLQAAVDYIAALGGGTVHIGAGTYTMYDSLHLRSGVTVIGSGAETILRKAPSTKSLLGLDGDFGEQQITLQEPDGFGVGKGVAIWDKAAGGFHVTVARITGQTGNTFSVDKPMMADYLVNRTAQAATVFPVISGYDIVDARIENLSIDGNRQENAHLNGCRGGGIFLYRAFGTVISDCHVTSYNGDGISFQQSNDVVVTRCLSENNSQLGLHPGSGSQRPAIKDCIARGNGTDGLFLCWRVRHGLFENNLLEGNGRFGISIGHKDTDNILKKNHVRKNLSHGVFFRNESLGMSPHRNELVENIIEDNGSEPGTAGIRVEGEARGLIFSGNTIRDTRPDDEQTQTVGVAIQQKVGSVVLRENDVKAEQAVLDRRESK